MTQAHDTDPERGGVMSEQPLWRLVAGQKMGPYAPEKLRPLMKDGRISPLDRFSYDGVTWRPPTDFPELLRAPVAPLPAPPQAASVRQEQPGADDLDAGGWDEAGVLPTADGGYINQEIPLDDAATKKLLAMIYGLIWVGVGVVVILVTLMIVTTVFYKPAVGSGQATPSKAQSPARAAKAAAAESKAEQADAPASDESAKESPAPVADEPTSLADGQGVSGDVPAKSAADPKPVTLP
jgi:hypothetical protein